MTTQVVDRYEVRIKQFFEGEERLNEDTTHTGGEYLLDMMTSFFHAEEGNDMRYTVIIFKNGSLINTSEQVSAETMKETCMRLCSYLDDPGPTTKAPHVDDARGFPCFIV